MENYLCVELLQAFTTTFNDPVSSLILLSIHFLKVLNVKFGLFLYQSSATSLILCLGLFNLLIIRNLLSDTLFAPEEMLRHSIQIASKLGSRTQGIWSVKAQTQSGLTRSDFLHCGDSTLR